MQKYRADLRPVGALALPPEDTRGFAAGPGPQGLLSVLTGLLEPSSVSRALCLCSKEKTIPSLALAFPLLGELQMKEEFQMSLSGVR